MAVRIINRNYMNAKATPSSGEDNTLQHDARITRYVDIQKVMNALEILEYPESYFSIQRMSSGRFCDENIKSPSSHRMNQQQLSSDRLMIERQYFDKMCRMFNLTLFRHHPTITEIKNYQKALKFYIVFSNNLEDYEIQQKMFMVCNDVYFQDYFTGGATTPKKSGDYSSRGHSLWSSYRKIRDQVLREWEKIFWRPSSTVTADALKNFHPYLKQRTTCPKIAIQVPNNDTASLFGMTGSSSNGLNCLLQVSQDWFEVETDGEEEEIEGTLEPVSKPNENLVRRTPFNFFMRVCYVTIQDIMMRLTDLQKEKILYFEPPLPQPPFTTKSLRYLKFQVLLNNIGVWITQAEKSLGHLDDMVELATIKKRYVDFLESLEGSEMHIFLAIWTMWGIPGRPYMLNLLERSETYEQFTNFVTPSFLGLFYMVRKH